MGSSRPLTVIDRTRKNPEKPGFSTCELLAQTSLRLSQPRGPLLLATQLLHVLKRPVPCVNDLKSYHAGIDIAVTKDV